MASEIDPMRCLCRKCGKHHPNPDCKYIVPVDFANTAKSRERTPQDYAIEHAEYMAQAAEQMIASVNDLAKAESEREDGQCNDSDVDAARESVTEAARSLRGGIYEFRKRRDRAASSIGGKMT